MLLSCVAITQGDGVFEIGVLSQSIKINGDAKRGADFVLSSVSFTHIAIIVPHYLGNFFFKVAVYLARFINQFWFIFEEWKYRRLYRSQVWRKFEEYAGFADD